MDNSLNILDTSTSQIPTNGSKPIFQKLVVHSSRPPLATRGGNQNNKVPLSKGLDFRRFESFNPIQNHKVQLQRLPSQQNLEEKENINNLSYEVVGIKQRQPDSQSTSFNMEAKQTRTRLYSAKAQTKTNLRIDTSTDDKQGGQDQEAENLKTFMSMSKMNQSQQRVQSGNNRVGAQSSKNSQNTSMNRNVPLQRFESFDNQKSERQNPYALQNQLLQRKQSNHNIVPKKVIRLNRDNSAMDLVGQPQQLHHIRAQSQSKSRQQPQQQIQSTRNIKKQESLNDVCRSARGVVESKRELKMVINLPLPHITAQSWAIYDINGGKFIQGKKENFKREVASITKMMTFYTTLRLMERFQLTPETTLVTVSRTASLVTGTSACLREGDQLSVLQLFYGLMLPSGNDAAFALAEHFGELLYQQKYANSNQHVNSHQFPNSIVRYFLKEMNLNAFKLRMSSTQYDSPHGLMNKHNYSTAHDICLLSAKCMEIPIYRQVVGTQTHQTTALKSKKTSPTKYSWENTNKLLGKYEGIVGCKTGITDAAGPCFSGCYEKDGERLIVVVLCSKTMESRWVEVPKMIDWVGRRRRLNEDYRQKQVSKLV